MEQKIETFGISKVSQTAGVCKNRIREWHDKGLLLHVERIPVGTRSHRRFTQDDIKLITKIDEYQKKGFVLKVAAQKAQEK
jgi:DNA-binding transcriptional MerR regulator